MVGALTEPCREVMVQRQGGEIMEPLEVALGLDT